MNSPVSNPLDRVLVLEMVRVTEAAAVAASKLIGRGAGILFISIAIATVLR